MTISTTKLIVALAAAAILGSVVTVGAYTIRTGPKAAGPTPSPSPSPVAATTTEQPKTEAASQAKPAELGRIEGSAAFPAGGHPADLQVCAANISTKKIACSEGVLKSDVYLYGIGYSLSVPAGTYQVYSVAPSFNPNYRGYYTKGTLCERDGGDYDKCQKDRSIVDVTVKAGETLGRIDATDFYGPHNNF